jgi:hypothetical protein
MVMIKGMVSASASVVYTLGLLILITYVFAIAFVNLAEEGNPIQEQYFSSVPESMHNLFMYGTFLDSLSTFLVDLKTHSVSCFLLGWLYVSIAALQVMNMLIGVLCEVISAVAEEEKESMIVEKVHDKFGSIVKELDEDKDGRLSWTEFQTILDKDEALAALESIGVDADCLIDVAEDFFHEDGEPLEIPFDEFMSMLLDLRSGQQATVKDTMRVGKKLSKIDMKISGRIDGLENRITAIEGKVIQMNNHMEDVSDKLDKVLARLERHS